MNNTTKNENEQAPEQVDEAAESQPAEAEGEQAEVEVLPPAKAMPLSAMVGPEDAIAWLKSNATPILVGLVIAALAYAGVSAYRNNQKSQMLTAQSQLFNAQQSAQFADVVAKYPNTPSAPLAELALGSQLFDEGKFDQSRATFAAFAQKHAGHPMAAGALLGLVQCDEAQSKTDAALAGYENFMKANKDSFLYAQALFGKGRCLSQLGRFDDARTLYEDFMTAHPKDPWLPRVQTELMYIAKAKRAASMPPPPMAPQSFAPPAAAPLSVSPVAAPAAK